MDILALVGHYQDIVDQQLVKLQMRHDCEEIAEGSCGFNDSTSEVKTAGLDLEVLHLLAQTLHVANTFSAINYADHY